MVLSLTLTDIGVYGFVYSASLQTFSPLFFSHGLSVCVHGVDVPRRGHGEAARECGDLRLPVGNT